MVQARFWIECRFQINPNNLFRGYRSHSINQNKIGGFIMIRKQIVLGLILLSLAFPNFAMAVDEKEIKFGFYADRMVVAQQTILFNNALNKRINEIGNCIAKASDRPDIKYTFRVVNDPTINAFAAAGGFVYVNTGLLDILESEDELAVILGHEIGHVSKKHQINFIHSAHRRKVAGKVVGVLLGAVLIVGTSAAVGPSNMPQQVADDMMDFGILVGDDMAISMIKGYGKKQELEADRLAVQYTLKAGYNPNALVSVFQRLKSIKNRLEYKERVRTASLVNAKPGLEERIKQAKDFISKLD